MRPLITAILLLVLLQLGISQNQQVHRFVGSRVITVESDYQYLLHTPDSQELAEEGKLPLIVFLHGSGERGTDMSTVKTHGPPKLADANPEFPFMVLSPQCPMGEWWDVQALDLLLDDVISNHPVDERRIYLTGLSMGGFGTWDLAILRPDRFAAIAPICGGDRMNAIDAPKYLRDTPTWVFHGAMDQVVKLEASSRIVKALNDAGGDVQFTIYPMAGHDSWTETYANPKLYDWFLRHRLPRP